METVRSINPYHQNQTERQQSRLLVTVNSSSVTDGECSDCSTAIESTDYNQQPNQVRSQEDAIEKEPGTRHFTVDLELPHPDQYLPETVDFPSSPSAMMKYRLGDEKDEQSGHGLQHYDVATDSEDEQSSKAVIDHHNNSVHLQKGRPQLIQQAQPESVRRKIFVIDDNSRVAGCIDDSYSDTECDSGVQPPYPVALPEVEIETTKSAEVQISHNSPETPSSKSDSMPTPEGWDNDCSSVENIHIPALPPRPDLIPETSVHEENDDNEHKKWRSVFISGVERKIDVMVIEPYKKVLSHGGYQSNDTQTAIIVFSACFLPDRARGDYDYVMENLFLYVLTTLDQLVAENYVLVYFHGATPKNCIPRFSWVKSCYQMIDRRLRKNLKRLYLVHPTLWLKAAVLMCRPFISAKFSRKIMYIPNLQSLSSELPMDHVCIPDRVKQYDMLKETLNSG